MDILARTGGKSLSGSEEQDSLDEEVGGGTGSKLRIKPWNQRKRQSMGYDPAVDSAKAKAQAAQIPIFPNEVNEKTVQRHEIPLIDQIHRLMHLWAAGNLDTLNAYAAEKGLRQDDLFWAVAQAVLEMAEPQSRERTLLEAVVAWGRGKSTGDLQEEQTRLF